MAAGHLSTAPPLTKQDVKEMEPEDKTTTVRISKELRKKAKLQAVKRNITLTALVESAILKELGRKED